MSGKSTAESPTTIEVSACDSHSDNEVCQRSDHAAIRLVLPVWVLGARCRSLLGVHDLAALHVDGTAPIRRLNSRQKSNAHVLRRGIHDLAGEMYDRSCRLPLDPEYRLLFIHLHCAAIGQLQLDTRPAWERIALQRHDACDDLVHAATFSKIWIRSARAPPDEVCCEDGRVTDEAWVWVLEAFAKGSDEFIQRWQLPGFTDEDAAALLEVSVLGHADLFDVSDDAVAELARRYSAKAVSPDGTNYYLIGRERV
jgi:hypothetical protein